MEESGKLYEICIQKGREHRAVLTPDRVDSPTEFFYNSYQDAKYQLREIVLASSQNREERKTKLTTKKSIELLHKYPNNIISFCADRGRGKTTAMLSFSNALERLGDSEKNSSKFWGDIPDKDQIMDVRFEVMAPIDPASMENSDSVLQQIISQLFENFCRKIKDNSYYESGGRDFDRDNLSDYFQQCAQAIDSLYKDSKTRDTLIEDELDKIAEIGQSAKLLLLLHELIDKYLDFMRGKGSNCCLVVQIDDADMDIGRSYQILEDVRKYLGLPRVIVLVATNIQQLETTVEQHFLKEYERGLQYDDSMITVERCHDIAVLYLEKAIPHPRRIYLPDIDETIRQHLSQLRVNYQDIERSAESGTNQEGENILSEHGTYQEQLLDLLHRKTGLVFTSEADYLHNLLPAHMRELCQFLPFFASMKDVTDGYEVAIEIFRNQSFPPQKNIPQFLNQWEHNLGRLEFYIVNLWSAVNLREGSRNLFREFAAQPETIRNLYLLRNIADYYVRERIALENLQYTAAGPKSDYRTEFVRACEMRGIDLNSYWEKTVQGEMCVSNADIMAVLDALTDLPGANRQYKFAYAIRLFCSIHLHKALIQEIRMIGNGEQSIRFHSLTDILRDTLLKNGPTNDTARTPFGCWILEMPVQWFPQYLLAGETNEPGKTATPFLRWKYKKDHTVYMVSAVDPHEATDIWRPVYVERGQKQSDVVVFSPLYPLLDTLDWFVRFKNVNQMRDDIRYRSQIYIALLICLNWDVQRILFKKIKNQADNIARRMLTELYTRHIGDLIKALSDNVPSWLVEPIAEKNGMCQAQLCYDTLWEGAKQEFFDVLTMRVHPVPEFRIYIKNANDGIKGFKEVMDKFYKADSKENTRSNHAQKEQLAVRVPYEILQSMNAHVQNMFFGADAAIIRVEEELQPTSALRNLLREYLERLQSKNFLLEEVISLGKLRFTPKTIYHALTNYRDLLVRLMQQGFDPADVSLIKEKVSAKQQRKTNQQTPNAVITDSNLTLENESEAAVKTLQNLIQLGQQILNVLTVSQPQETVGDERK